MYYYVTRKKTQKDVQIKQQKIQGFHRPPSQNIFFNETSINQWKVRAFREPALTLPLRHFNPDKFSSYLKIDLSGVRGARVYQASQADLSKFQGRRLYQPELLLAIRKLCHDETSF